MSFFDKFDNKYIIIGTLVAESPLHIGAGTVELSPTSVDNPVIRDEKGNPFIPGSSLKGVLRCFAERIIPSLYDKNEIWSCNILDKPCLDNEFINSIKQDKELSDLEKAEKLYKSECDVCKLFGGNSFGSKLTINDGKLIGKKAYMKIRDGIAVDRDTLTAAHGIKYDYETVSTDTMFSFEMTIENLEDKHKEIIRLLLNYLESGDMKVGGKTSAGLGCIRLIDKKVYKIDKSNLKSFYIDGLKGNEDKFKGDL